jgi:DNA-directed RNA polymerase subunit E'
MYIKLKIRDSVRVPPRRFEENLEEVVRDLLWEKFEGIVDKEYGVIIAIISIDDIGDGRILEGDGAVYFDVVFTALAFKPVLQEIVEGKVVEVVEFGAFVSIGPLDALLHMSQVTDDYLVYDDKNRRLIGKEKGLSITEGDKVRARIVAISLNEREPRNSKIGLTMRQPGLGNLLWLEAERENKKGEK